MDFITERIAIGDGVEAEDEELLIQLGITHVLNVHPMDMDYTKVKYAKIPWHDEGNFERLDEALEFIDEGLKGNGKVMVICGAGIERSPLTVFAYLHIKCGLDIWEALNKVKSKRTQCTIHLEWLKGWDNIAPEDSNMYRRHF